MKYVVYTLLLIATLVTVSANAAPDAKTAEFYKLLEDAENAAKAQPRGPLRQNFEALSPTATRAEVIADVAADGRLTGPERAALHDWFMAQPAH